MTLDFKKSSPAIDPDEIFADSVSVLGKGTDVDHKIERPLNKIGSFVFILTLAAGIGYLAYRGAYLSLEEGNAFFAKSQENRFFGRPIFSPRGIIYDYRGKPLVENIPHFGLIFERRLFQETGGELDSLLEELGAILDKPIDFFFELGFPANLDITRLPRRIVILQGLTAIDLIPIMARLETLPGVQIFEGYRRIYRAPLSYAHVVGFVGRVSIEDLEKRPELNTQEIVGKNGIESYYDDMLRGTSGRKILEVNAAGEETRFKLLENPREGLRLNLTIDGEWQEFIYRTLESFTQQQNGASVVAIDPQSGAVKALVSFPGFNINEFSYLLPQNAFERLLDDPLKPFFNRAISGEFPSGSTIKPLVATAALEEKIIDPLKQIYDEGFIEIPNPYRPGENSRFLDWKKHGWVNFYDALAQSANVYFYMIGGGYRDQIGLGIEKIKEYALLFGLGSKTGIDLPGEKPGSIPDPATKPLFEPENPTWRIGDTYNVSIGQGGVKVTPLQMAVLTAAIGNGGRLYRPYTMDSATDGNNGLVEKRRPELIKENIVNEESLRHVIRGMRQAVTAGTAGRLSGLPVQTAAKTGTAQAGSGLPHAWVAVLAPVEKPEIALVVMVEHAGEGSTVAVPITYEILKWYFANRH